MCLNSIENKPKKVIGKLKLRKDGYIRLWKVFDVDANDNLVAQFHEYSFYEGKNTATGVTVWDYQGDKAYYQYGLGFHCFGTKKDAEEWKEDSCNDHCRERTVVPIKVKKSWITTVGYQSGDTVFVCKHIFI